MPVTLEKVKKDMRDFPHELQMYCYHHMNNRIDEAQTYLDAYNDMQDSIKQELTTVEEIDDEDNTTSDHKCNHCKNKYSFLEYSNDDDNVICDKCYKFFCGKCVNENDITYFIDKEGKYGINGDFCKNCYNEISHVEN
jgi:beta-N-acetylglucosaminidase